MSPKIGRILRKSEEETSPKSDPLHTFLVSVAFGQHEQVCTLLVPRPASPPPGARDRQDCGSRPDAAVAALDAAQGGHLATKAAQSS